MQPDSCTVMTTDLYRATTYSKADRSAQLGHFLQLFPPRKMLRGLTQVEDSVKAANTKTPRGIKDGRGGTRKTEGVLGSFKSRGRRSTRELRTTEGLSMDQQASKQNRERERSHR